MLVSLVKFFIIIIQIKASNEAIDSVDDKLISVSIDNKFIFFEKSAPVFFVSDIKPEKMQKIEKIKMGQRFFAAKKYFSSVFEIPNISVKIKNALSKPDFLKRIAKMDLIRFFNDPENQDFLILTNDCIWVNHKYSNDEHYDVTKFIKIEFSQPNVRTDTMSETSMKKKENEHSQLQSSDHGEALLNPELRNVDVIHKGAALDDSEMNSDQETMLFTRDYYSKIYEDSFPNPKGQFDQSKQIIEPDSTLNFGKQNTFRKFNYKSFNEKDQRFNIIPYDLLSINRLSQHKPSSFTRNFDIHRTEVNTNLLRSERDFNGIESFFSEKIAHFIDFIKAITNQLIYLEKLYFLGNNSSVEDNQPIDSKNGKEDKVEVEGANREDKVETDGANREDKVETDGANREDKVETDGANREDKVETDGANREDKVETDGANREDKVETDGANREDKVETVNQNNDGVVNKPSEDFSECQHAAVLLIKAGFTPNHLNAVKEAKIEYKNSHLSKYQQNSDFLYDAPDNSNYMASISKINLEKKVEPRVLTPEEQKQDDEDYKNFIGKWTALQQKFNYKYENRNHGNKIKRELSSKDFYSDLINKKDKSSTDQNIPIDLRFTTDNSFEKKMYFDNQNAQKTDDENLLKKNLHLITKNVESNKHDTIYLNDIYLSNLKQTGKLNRDNETNIKSINNHDYETAYISDLVFIKNNTSAKDELNDSLPDSNQYNHQEHAVEKKNLVSQANINNSAANLTEYTYSGNILNQAHLEQKSISELITKVNGEINLQEIEDFFECFNDSNKGFWKFIDSNFF